MITNIIIIIIVSRNKPNAKHLGAKSVTRFIYMTKKRSRISFLRTKSRVSASFTYNNYKKIYDPFGFLGYLTLV